MNNIALEDYTWLDIIEPAVTTTDNLSWLIYLGIFFAVFIVVFLAYYFKFNRKVKIWWILTQLKSNQDIRKCARKMLDMISLCNESSVYQYREHLLIACYAKQSMSYKEIKNIIKKLDEAL